MTKKELLEEVEKFNKYNEEWGFDEGLELEFEDNKVWFIGEFDYEEGMNYVEKLDKIIQKENKNWYFDAEDCGRFVAYLN